MSAKKAAKAPPGGKYERRKLSELSLDPENVRKHSNRNLDAIKASLQRFGQQKPIVVGRAGVVLAGNGTLAAAQALGWTEIDCVVTELRGSDARAFTVADNRSAELAEWDGDALAELLQSFEAEDVALLEATGFTGADLGAMLPAAEGFEAPMLQEELNHGSVSLIFTEPDGLKKLIDALGLKWIHESTKEIRWPQTAASS